MAKFASETRSSFKLVAHVLGVALIILVLPARLTAPARTIFTQAVGPAEEITFNVAGDALAATGTFRDALLNRERDRARDAACERLRNTAVAWKEQALQLQQRLDSFEKLQALPAGAQALHGFPFRALSVPVTAYDSSGARRSITIAAGRGDGVRAGQAVTASGALVGIVTEVGPWRSRVRLITDAAAAIPCRVQRTREMCVLQGTGAPQCRADWIRREMSVQVGDALVTAVPEGSLTAPPLAPAGLPVAAVVRVESGRKEPLFQEVAALPLADASRLEVVEVLVPEAASQQ